MKVQLAFNAFVAFGMLSCSSALDSNPLSKVIELLDSLAAKIKKEGDVEAKAYKDFFEWCDDASTSKNFEIKTLTAKEAKLEAAIAESAAESDEAATKIDELGGSIAAGQADLKNATIIREKEAADFTSNEQELLDVIDTLDRAIKVLSKQMAKNPAAFAQIDTSNMDSVLKSLNLLVDAAAFSSADHKKLSALIQSRQTSDDDDAEAETSAPAAASYKTHSSSIVDVLDDMKDKAEEELSSLRKAESTAKHNFQMLKQSLEDQIADDSKHLDQEKAAKSAADGEKAAAQGDLEKTQKDLADAKATLETTNANCMETAADHDASIKARSEELNVIAEGKKILVSTTSGAESQTYSLIQLRSGSKLKSHADLANAELISMVKQLAREQHSAALSSLASRIATVLRLGRANGEDPFVKVKGLISDLISKLETEAETDATEKAYCDEQMAKTEAKKEELEAIMKKLTTKIDQAAAKSAGLKEEVKALQAELAALSKEQAQLDKARTESHAAYVTAKAELEEGIAGVRQALSVLRDYYGSGAASALLQNGAGLATVMEQPAVPQHSKAAGSGGGIIGILEVVESDFAKNLAAEETAEADAAAEYEKVTQENKVTKTIKDADVKYKTQEFVALDKNMADLSSDKDTTGSELDAVLEYLGKVKERCIAKPESYGERKKRREAEIAGLKEALHILENETAFMQHGRKGTKQAFLGF